MNQNFIAGIGNLYADEILYQSRIHPLTTADKLDKDKLKKLFNEMKMVLNKAIEYQDTPHNMPSNFLLSHRYQGGECPNGGSLITLKIGGRTTYLCPEYQKKV
jgi:formamidopyrimidine-DNA glycosylase